MKKVSIITPEEAALKVQDGDTIATGGFVSCACPETLSKALEKRFLETGHPQNQTLFFAAGQGHRDGTGGDHYGHEGMVKRVIGGHWDRAPKLGELALNNKIEAYNLPQGVISHMYRDIAAHNIGTITHVGLNTFVDPRHEGGKLNECTKEDLVKLVNIDGEERLLYKPIPINVCLVRGSYADEYGNCTVHREIGSLDITAQCQAAKNSGGIVIVQVEYLAQAGTLNPKDVAIPGIMVDYVVQATDKDCCWQTEGVYYEPAFSGQIKKPLNQLPVLDLSPRKVICRRCAMELQPGAIVNLGVGIPADVASVVAESGCLDKMTITAEAGGIGGVPAALPNFGSNYNAEAIISHNSMFDFIDGGGLDITVLGLAEVDKDGNLNVSKFGNRLSGPGGLIDITQSASTVIFAGTFMAKAKEEVADGKLEIVEEGTSNKFVDEVQQITYAGTYARPDQKVLYVTERCVMELRDGVMTIVEVAPGIDVDRDIIAHMDFVPAIADDVREMDPALFQEEWDGLKDVLGC